MVQKKTKYTMAVAGAAGVAARELIEILDERRFPASDVLLFDTEEAAGERIEYQGKSRTVQTIEKDSFNGVDIVFFATDPDTALAFAPAAVRSGAVVIDLSGAYRMDAKVPLIVPEVNASALPRHSGIVASPGASAVAAALVLNPIHQALRVNRIVLTAFESVSASGKTGMDELAQQTVALLNFRDVEVKEYPHQIAFNCLPRIDAFLENASTNEEESIAKETRKILGDESIRAAVTAVRVPVFRGHSAVLNIETAKPATANEVRATLSSAPGLLVYDDPGKELYPTPVDASGKDETYIGRIREDESVPNGISCWVVSDNLRKGSALNAVQIAELLIR